VSAADLRGFVTVPDGKIYFERTGEGPALVLVHSAFLDSRLWDPEVPTFARYHTVIRYDIRGHGRSTGDRADSSDAEDLTAVLNQLEVRQAFLLGNSDGARIVAEFAAGFPDRTRGLILVAGTPHDLEPTREEEVRFMDTIADREQALLELTTAGRKEEAIDFMLDLWAPRAPPPERERLRTIAQENYEESVRFLKLTEPEGKRPAYPVAASLEKGNVPMLSLFGAHDSPALGMMMGRFAQQVPSARHYELPEGDHTASVSSRPEFETLVLEFLAAVEGGRPWPPPKD
jgi:3-oxoadipate enol-lactonase